MFPLNLLLSILHTRHTPPSHPTKSLQDLFLYGAGVRPHLYPSSRKSSISSRPFLDTGFSTTFPLSFCTSTAFPLCFNIIDGVDSLFSIHPKQSPSSQTTSTYSLRALQGTSLTLKHSCPLSRYFSTPPSLPTQADLSLPTQADFLHSKHTPSSSQTIPAWIFGVLELCRVQT